MNYSRELDQLIVLVSVIIQFLHYNFQTRKCWAVHIPKLPNAKGKGNVSRLRSSRYTASKLKFEEIHSSHTYLFETTFQAKKEEVKREPEGVATGPLVVWFPASMNWMDDTLCHQHIIWNRNWFQKTVCCLDMTKGFWKLPVFRLHRCLTKTQKDLTIGVPHEWHGMFSIASALGILLVWFSLTTKKKFRVSKDR